MASITACSLRIVPAKASASMRTRSVPAAKPVAAVTLRKQTARMTKVFAAKVRIPASPIPSGA
jgi:hypothetical protein